MKGEQWEESAMSNELMSDELMSANTVRDKAPLCPYNGKEM